MERPGEAGCLLHTLACVHCALVPELRTARLLKDIARRIADTRRVPWICLMFYLLLSSQIIQPYQALLQNFFLSGQSFGKDHGRRQRCDTRKQRCCPLSGVLDQQLIYDNECGHRLNDGHSTRNNARVVAPTGRQGPRRSVVLCSLLLL